MRYAIQSVLEKYNKHPNIILKYTLVRKINNKFMKNDLLELPILQDDGFLLLNDIFNQYHIKLFAVGGCVRDCILNNNTDLSKIDIDLAISIKPDDVIVILAENNIKYFTTGLEFGTVTAHINGKNYEITSFRQDIQTNGRHAVVAYTDNMELDAQRRDFTINALYYDNQGTVYDPLEKGLADLQKGKVYFIGNAHARIQEDYLRILRYFRFLARFGMHSYDKTIFTSYNYCEGIKILSEHRIRNELRKMLRYPFIREVLSEIIDLKYHDYLFKKIVLSVSIFNDFKSININSDYLLPSLFFQTDKQQLKQNILLSKEEKKHTIEFATLYASIKKYLITQEWASILELQYDYNVILWQNLLCLFKNEFKSLENKIKAVRNISLPPFSLTGKLLLEQGYQQGSEISIILKQKRKEFVSEFLLKNFNF